MVVVSLDGIVSWGFLRLEKKRPRSFVKKQPETGEFQKEVCADGFLFYQVSMILPQVHLRKPCYDFSFLEMFRFK